MKRLIFGILIFFCIFASSAETNKEDEKDDSEYAAFIFTGMEEEESWFNEKDYHWMIETNSKDFVKNYFSGDNSKLLSYVTKDEENDLYRFTKVGTSLMGGTVEIKGIKNNFDYVLERAVEYVDYIYVSYEYVPEATYCIRAEGLLDEVVTQYRYLYDEYTSESHYALTEYAYKYADVYEQCKYFEDYSEMPKRLLDEYFAEKAEKESE